MGAWIETSNMDISEVVNTSHPMWVRGLKQYLLSAKLKHCKVAPYVGAWIETV